MWSWIPQLLMIGTTSSKGKLSTWCGRRNSGGSKPTGQCNAHKQVLDELMVRKGPPTSSKRPDTQRIAKRKNRQSERCHHWKTTSLAGDDERFDPVRRRRSFTWHGYLRVPPSSDAASSSAVPLRVPHQTPMTCIARHPTTTIELVFVLGYTFHAHSCAAQTAYITIGFNPDLHSKNGVDHAM